MGLRAGLPAILTTLVAAFPAPSQSYVTIGEGCPGSAGVPLLEAFPGSQPRIADAFTAQLTSVPDFGFAVGITGLSNTSWGVLSLPADLTLIGMPGCLLHTDIRRQQALAINNGIATWDLDLPDGPEWLGQTFFQQAFVLDDSVPGLGGVMSDAAAGIIGPNESLAPAVVVTFPPPISLTDASSAVVRGTASDPDGVAEVRVNGQLATTTDGFANWEAGVVLPQGPTKLSVESIDTLGYPTGIANEVIIRSEFLVGIPDALAPTISLDSAVMAYDGELFSVNIFTAEKTLVSGPTLGSGPDIGVPKGIALSGTHAYLVSGLSVIGIDIVSGNRIVVSDNSNGNGPPFQIAGTIAVSGSTGFVSERSITPGSDSLEAIFKVDLITGDRSLLSYGFGSEQFIVGMATNGITTFVVSREDVANDGCFRGVNSLSGEHVWAHGWNQFANGMALDGSRVLVIEKLYFAPEPPRLYAYHSGGSDPSPEVISGDGVGSGPLILSSQGIATNGAVALVSDGSYRSMLEVDLTTGDRTPFSGRFEVGTGAPLGNATALALDSTNAVVLDPQRGSLLAVDLHSSIRRVVADSSTGTGKSLVGGTGVAIDGGFVFVLTPHSLLSVDFVTGNRSVVSDVFVGNGPSLQDSRCLAIDGERALVVDRTLQAVVAIDLATGNRVIVSDAFKGQGRGLSEPTGIVVDGSRALISQLDDVVLEVDLITGDRKSFSLLGIDRVSIALAGNYAYALGREAMYASEDRSDPIVGVDLSSLQSKLVSTKSIGAGPIVSSGVAIAAFGSRLLVAEAFHKAILQVDLENGDRVFLSK